MEFETRAIHAGQDPDPTTGAIVTPIYQTSTYVQEEVGKHKGYEYSRTGNPTRTALESCLASLEGATHGLAFASGLAASDAVLRLLSPGDHILIPNDAYGGTFRLVDKVFEPAGYAYTPVDMTSLDNVRAAWRDETRMIWIESPTNPLLTVVDIVALNDGARAQRLAFLQNAVGAVPAPFDCWLVLRGVKTLAVRMDRHCANARAVAEMLASHDAVARVLYPGLPGHPGHEIATKQMRDFGGMVSFICRGGRDAALKIAASTRVFALAESLGAVESLIEHPAVMTHASAEGSPLAVDPALIRLSVGIEAAGDLLDDLRRGLDTIS
jgi:cystathionine gamma-synthase